MSNPDTSKGMYLSSLIVTQALKVGLKPGSPNGWAVWVIIVGSPLGKVLIQEKRISTLLTISFLVWSSESDSANIIHQEIELKDNNNNIQHLTS